MEGLRGCALSRTTMAETGQGADTFPRLLLRNASIHAGLAAMREKRFGIWRSWSWAQARDETRLLAAGLAALGLQRGERMAILGDNRPRLYWGMCAAQMLGAVAVPLYQDGGVGELGFVIDHADADIVLAENQEQVDKLLAIRALHGRPSRIVFLNARGLRDDAEKGLYSIEALGALGAKKLEAQPDFIDVEIARGAAGDVAVLLYSSGTTGVPKGIMLSHENVIRTAANAARFDGLTVADDMLAYLPMAWAGDHILAFGQSFVVGFCLSCPESGDTVLTDLREIGPRYFVAPPRIYENLLASVVTRMAGAGESKQALYAYCMALARRGADAGGKLSLAMRVARWLGDMLIYAPLRTVLGLSRVRLAYVVGDAIGPEVFAFYRAIGLNLKQLYGTTEASAVISMQPDGAARAGSVGLPAPEVAVRVAENGEILVRGPGVFLGYHKDPAATTAARTAEGWLRTGDTGVLDADGQLRIIDRAEDILVLPDGTPMAPKSIENRLKFFPYIKEAMVFADDRGRVVGLIGIDAATVGAWAERRLLSFGSYQELTVAPEVLDLLQTCIAEVNRDLAGDPATIKLQIARFLVLPKELDADDGELTRTRKMRRRLMAERYAPLIAALRENRERARINATITFEDGRVGTIDADLIVRVVPA